jgi:glycosyltransferase involved in cell wall biosynthesis
MKLALLVEYYPPSRASAAVQMSDLASAFARHGHEVTVFTTSPDATSAAVTEQAPGITVLRVPTSKTKGIGLARRALSEIFMSHALWRGTRHCRLRVDNFDGVIWYSPTIFLAPFVAWLKRRSGARAYLILRDIFPQWAVDAGVMRRGVAYHFFRAFEGFQYRTADVIGVQSPANLDHVLGDTGRRDDVEVLYNWLELDRPEPAAHAIRDAHALEGKRILVYGGNMGVAQDVDNLVRLAQAVRVEPQIHLLLVGSGSEVARLKRVLIERELTNVTLTDEVDPEQFRAILRRCAIGLITLDRRLSTHNIPGKLLAYLEAGLPVLASVNPHNDLLTILHESGAGIGFVNGQDRELAQCAIELARDAERCRAIAERARVLARERFSVERAVQQLTSALGERSTQRVTAP